MSFLVNLREFNLLFIPFDLDRKMRSTKEKVVASIPAVEHRQKISKNRGSGDNVHLWRSQENETIL
jgi:hypothetical protein